MKKQDFYFACIAFALFFPFIPFSWLSCFHNSFLYNENYWIITSFLKFALLATVGEILGYRIKTGKYLQKGFGILPRMFVWGLLGIFIKIAFVVFAAGAPVFLEKYLWVKDGIKSMDKNLCPDVITAFSQNLGWTRIFAAFMISLTMNSMFSAIMMTIHKITDTHIDQTKGSFSRFFSVIRVGEIFPAMNWSVQWDFVFKRTIPLFWLPAHTITFLLPSELRMVFAGLLSIVLGVFLAVASQKAKK